jgi:N-succinyl-L-ornithine transcarbamylase
MQQSFRSFTSVADVPDVAQLLQEAHEIKKQPLLHAALGKHKTLGLLFFNASLRTRISTQKAAHNLGMNVVVINVGTESWKLEFDDGAVMDGDTVEHIKEGAAVLGQYCDILAVRAFAGLQNREEDYSEPVLNSLMRYAGVPILSLESATRHPLQSFADLITIQELTASKATTTRPKVVLTWAPHPRALPQAVPNSFAEWMRRADVDLVITHPKGFELSEEFTHDVPILYDQDAALEGADIVYPKNWSPYAHNYGAALGSAWREYAAWTVNAQKLARTNNAKVLHCLPTRRNVEIADDVLDSTASAVIQEAANRVYAAQTVLKRMIESLS